MECNATTQNTSPERVILVGLACSEVNGFDNSTPQTLAELEELVLTAGGECVGQLTQNKHKPDPRTLIGEGKVEELTEYVQSLEATLIVFDNLLSPSQTRNLEKDCDVRVIDRSVLILDIFASRAQTKEGKLQVELAQYKYTLPRLFGKGVELSRLGGGIGTRGPGETKLETDRRHIKRLIEKLEQDLAEVRKNRNIQRRQREKGQIPLVSLVGYTNAGKSTLFNLLTDAGVSVRNRLFETLDPTVKRFEISPGNFVLMSDTVGFIRKLPHHLVEAFKATLEELLFADLLLHVVDASSPESFEHMQVVDSLIEQLGAGDKPALYVFNKIDLAPEFLPATQYSVCISAKTGDGVPGLLDKIIEACGLDSFTVQVKLGYDQARLVDMMYKEAVVESLDYAPEHILAKITAPKKFLSIVEQHCEIEYE